MQSLTFLQKFLAKEDKARENGIQAFLIRLFTQKYLYLNSRQIHLCD